MFLLIPETCFFFFFKAVFTSNHKLTKNSDILIYVYDIAFKWCCFPKGISSQILEYGISLFKNTILDLP